MAKQQQKAAVPPKAPVPNGPSQNEDMKSGKGRGNNPPKPQNPPKK